jgi:hypothetical protein
MLNDQIRYQKKGGIPTDPSAFRARFSLTARLLEHFHVRRSLATAKGHRWTQSLRRQANLFPKCPDCTLHLDENWFRKSCCTRACSWYGGFETERVPERGSLLRTPEVLKPCRAQLGVAHRMLDILMSQVGLERPRVVAVIGELIAAGVP